MKLHAKIPQGCYLIDVQHPARWDAVRLTLYMKGVPLRTKACDEGMEETHPTIEEADLMLIASIDPRHTRRMQEVHTYLGISS